MPQVRAVLFDFGGVIRESPFIAFRQFERARSLPEGFLQGINRRNPEDNAWARFERSELTPEQFDEAFADECRQCGHEVRGLDVIDLIYGPVRPRMVQAVARCREHFLTACLTNNVHSAKTDASPRAEQWLQAVSLFHQVIESSRVGVRKPERRYFELACRRLGIGPAEAVFLDDLGANLKPARALGMRTIKVEDPARALAELEDVLELNLG